MVVLSSTRSGAEYALKTLHHLLATLGLKPKEEKNRIVYLAEGSGGLDFLGFFHKWVRGHPRGGTSRPAAPLRRYGV